MSVQANVAGSGKLIEVPADGIDRLELTCSGNGRKFRIDALSLDGSIVVKLDGLTPDQIEHFAGSMVVAMNACKSRAEVSAGITPIEAQAISIFERKKESGRL